MRGVGRSGLAYPKPDFQIVLVKYPAETVSTYRIVATELCFIHMPEFRTTHPGVKFANVFDVLQCELLSGRFCECCVLVVLIIRLLAHAKQFTKEPDTIASTILCVQVPYCLAPAFFRIGILNLASATLIISS